MMHSFGVSFHSLSPGKINIFATSGFVGGGDGPLFALALT